MKFKEFTLHFINYYLKSSTFSTRLETTATKRKQDEWIWGFKEFYQILTKNTKLIDRIIASPVINGTSKSYVNILVERNPFTFFLVPWKVCIACQNPSHPIVPSIVIIRHVNWFRENKVFCFWMTNYGVLRMFRSWLDLISQNDFAIFIIAFVI